MFLLALLWIVDIVQTVKLTKKYGNNIEENPVARFFLKQSRKEFVMFKIVDFAVLSTIMIFSLSSQIFIANCLLGVFILLYIFTVLHNFVVSKKYALSETV